MHRYGGVARVRGLGVWSPNSSRTSGHGSCSQELLGSPSPSPPLSKVVSEVNPTQGCWACGGRLLGRGGNAVLLVACVPGRQLLRAHVAPEAKAGNTPLLGTPERLSPLMRVYLGFSKPGGPDVLRVPVPQRADPSYQTLGGGPLGPGPEWPRGLWRPWPFTCPTACLPSWHPVPLHTSCACRHGLPSGRILEHRPQPLPASQRLSGQRHLTL